ncbi:MAG TPA: AAA family ATPase, partial [Mycobacteriales bacterium]
RFAEDAREHRGSSQRLNRNMVVFLAPDGKRLDELAEATRHFLAWEWINNRIEELNLSPQQVSQVRENLGRTDEAVTARIAQTYHWALVPEQPDAGRPARISVEKADGGSGHLAERVTDKLTRAGLLAGSVAARAIRLDLEQKLDSVWERGHVAVGELWAYYCHYPYMTRLRDRKVLDEGVASALGLITFQIDGFALAAGFDEATGRYTGLVLPGGDAHFGQVTDATLLVRPDLAIAQDEEDRRPDPVPDPDPEPSPGAGAGPDTGTGGGTGPEPGARSGHGSGPGPGLRPDPEPAPPRNTRYFGVYRVSTERYGRDLANLGQEILSQLAAVDGADLEVTVEVHARRPEGFPDDKVRTVLENARTLHFTQSGFEDD